MTAEDVHDINFVLKCENFTAITRGYFIAYVVTIIIGQLIGNFRLEMWVKMMYCPIWY